MEMHQELSFASIRLGDVTANDAWKLLSPWVETDDRSIASQVVAVLRSWTWKALDRRRRDSSLREWVDLLNRVEAFLADRFEALAAKIDTLVELLHESIAVAELSTPEKLLRRKHVAEILSALKCHQGEWIERAALMDELALKPANTTRLMSLLIDIGWVEQVITGREAEYRLSAEGLSHAPTRDWVAVKSTTVDEQAWVSAMQRNLLLSVASVQKAHSLLSASGAQSREWLHVDHDTHVIHEDVAPFAEEDGDDMDWSGIALSTVKTYAPERLLELTS
jgi:hypothetical protein